MTEAEAIKVIGIVVAYFLGRFTKESIAIWAKQMLPYSYEDGVEGANDHGGHSDHPSIKELKVCIEAARKRRCDRAAQDLNRKALPAVASIDPEQDAKTRAAMKAAIDEFISRRSMPKVRAVDSAPDVRVDQTFAEAEERRRVLREQAERLIAEDGASK